MGNMQIAPAADSAREMYWPMVRAANWAAHAVTVFIAAVFIDSLRFKFTNASKTQVIFGDLDQWAASFGAQGLFAETGLFSQYVIGGAELAASAILIFSMAIRQYRFLQPVGALLSLAVMSGAISFHLFTPLGVNVAGDGGALFYTACSVWVGALALLVFRAAERVDLVLRLRSIFSPSTAVPPL